MTIQRTTKRRPVELVAACMDHCGKDGLKVAVTISTPAGLHRELFACGPGPRHLATVFHVIGDWLEREYVKAKEVA